MRWHGVPLRVVARQSSFCPVSSITAVGRVARYSAANVM
jgi:hypothetical protein